MTRAPQTSGLDRLLAELADNFRAPAQQLGPRSMTLIPRLLRLTMADFDDADWRSPVADNVTTTNLLRRAQNIVVQGLNRGGLSGDNLPVWEGSGTVAVLRSDGTLVALEQFDTGRSHAFHMDGQTERRADYVGITLVKAVAERVLRNRGHRGGCFNPVAARWLAELKRDVGIADTQPFVGSASSRDFTSVNEIYVGVTGAEGTLAYREALTGLPLSGLAIHAGNNVDLGTMIGEILAHTGAGALDQFMAGLIAHKVFGASQVTSVVDEPPYLAQISLVN